MTSTDRLVAGVIAALLKPAARLYETKAAFGVVIVCVAFATTIEVMMATTVAKRMTPGRENFCIRILIAFILFGFLLCGFSYVWSQLDLRRSRQAVSQRRPQPTNVFSVTEDSLKRRVTQSDAFLPNPASACQASLF